MILLSVDDFDNGFLAIATNNFTEDDLQDYIDRYETFYICKILGAVFGQALIAEIAGTVSPANQVLLDEWKKNDSCGKLIFSRGLKEALKGLIFYHVIANQDSESTQAGTTRPVSETSVRTQAAGTARRRYNDALDTIDAIRWKCTVDAREDYPDYKGEIFKPSFAGIL